MSPPSADELPETAEFDCGCYVSITPDWTLTLWQCPAGNNCPSWRLIQGYLDLAVRQLRIHALGRSL